MKRLAFTAAAFVLFTAAAVCQETNLPHITTTVIRSLPADAVVIDGEKLKNFSSAEQALESAGFSFKKTNDELTFHGYWNSSIKVYTNGILMNDPNTGKFDFSTLDFDSVKSIKIDTSAADGAVSVYIGTFSSDYNSAHGEFSAFSKSYLNSINDTSGAKTSFSVPLVFESGSALYLQENLSVSQEKNHYGYRQTDFSKAPSFLQSYSGYKKEYAGHENILANNSLCISYSDARLPGATAALSSYISFADENCGVTGGTYYTRENQKKFSFATSLPVFIPHEKWNIKILPSYKFSDLDYTNDARKLFLRNRYSVNNCTFFSEATVLDFLKFTANISYDFSDENHSTVKKTEDSSQTNAATEQKISHTLFTSSFSAAAAFDFYGWNITLALPVNYFDPSKTWTFLYNACIQKKIILPRSDSIDFFIRASRNSTSPVFQQLYYSGSGGKGNESLVPETAFSFTAGSEYKGKINAFVKPFLVFYKDKIGWNYNGTEWLCENFGSSVNYGSDFFVSSAKLFDPFFIDASYTFCRARLTSDSSVRGNQIMYTPVHSLSLSCGISFLKNFKWSAQFTYFSKKFTDNSNKSFIPDYYNLDTKLEWKSSGLSLSLLWKNVFDFQYAAADSTPYPGTSLTLSVSLSF